MFRRLSEKSWLIAVILTLTLKASVCSAAGWNDFELDIGDGYTIVKCNSMDVCIGKKNGRLILYPDKYDDVGPVSMYFTTKDFIFTKNIGKIHRNLFKGDTLQDIDRSREFYFIISKENGDIAGPFSKLDFMSHPNVANINSIDWRAPRNPNILVPFFGKLLFLVFAFLTLILAIIKNFWISIPLMTITMFVVAKIIRRKKEKWKTKDSY